MSSPILDLHTFGRRLRALRVLRGYDRVTDLGAHLRTRYGVEVSDRTLYAIERGEQPPHLDLFLTMLATLHPEVGYFDPALRDDVAAAVRLTA